MTAPMDGLTIVDADTSMRRMLSQASSSRTDPRSVALSVSSGTAGRPH